MHSIHQAVKALRTELGESQQAFATRLGLSIRAIVNYESNRVPSLKVLAQLVRVAWEHGKPDLAKPLYDHIRAEIGSEIQTPGRIEGIAAQFHIAIRRLNELCKKRRIDPTSEDVQKLQAVLEEGMRAAFSLCPLADPKYFDGDPE